MYINRKKNHPEVDGVNMDATDWKLIDQFVEFWWCAMCSSGTLT